MQALVRMPHTLENGMPIEFTITGNVPTFYIDLTRRLFPNIKETNEDEELSEISKSKWYKETRAKMKPSENLKLLRKNRGLTQKALAEKSGLAATAISDMEHERIPIGRKSAQKLATALGTSVSNLFW